MADTLYIPPLRSGHWSGDIDAPEPHTSVHAVDEPTDPLTEPLPCAPPGSWKGREDRVAWCLHNLTRGEQAKFFRTLYDTKGIRIDNARDIERTETKTCSA